MTRKKIEELVKELNKLDTKIKNNIQIINLTPTKATSDLLTIEPYDGNSIRVPLSQLTVKLPYYEKIKSQLSDGSIVDMEVGLYTTTPEVESSKTDGDKKKDKDKTDKKKKMQLLKKVKILQHQRNKDSEEETNSENSGIQTEENPPVGQKQLIGLPCSRLILNNKKRKMLTFYVFLWYNSIRIILFLYSLQRY
ncbi:MAG: hypothetical protein ACLTZB_03005 [Streptococcus salivarius]